MQECPGRPGVTHKVAGEEVVGPSRRNMMHVTLSCTGCKRIFPGSAQWKIGREKRELAIDRARRKAETAFREHLEIR